MRRVEFWVALVTLGVALIALSLLLASSAHAAPPKPAAMLPPVGQYPDAECKEENGMDFYLGPDNHFWECICEKLFMDVNCSWYDQGPIKSAAIKRRIRALHHWRVIPRGVLVEL